jgi:hypothetical protein
MKTKLFTIALSVIFALCLSMPTEVSARNHRVPFWAPAHGYRAQTRQVYFPEYNMYYDIQRGVYISIDNGRWSASMDLPIRLGNVNFRNARYVELNVNSRAPQCYNDDQRGYRYDDRYNNDNRSYNNNDRRYSEYRRDNRREDQYRNNNDDRRRNNREEHENHNDRDDD